jgi:Zinc finger, C2H2 type
MSPADDVPIAPYLDYPKNLVTEQSPEMDSFFTAPATEANTTTLTFQYHPSLLGSPSLPTYRPELPLDEVTRSSYYLAVSFRDPSEIFYHSSYFAPAEGDSSLFLTCPEPDVIAEATDPKPAGPSETPPHSESQGIHRPVHHGHKCGHSAQRIGVQETCDRICRYSCPDCGKCFSGQSERNRHIRSKHRPPTLGCRKCDYRQSRKDLFREHCKKRHPGELIEDLLVRLAQVDRRAYKPGTTGLLTARGNSQP